MKLLGVAGAFLVAISLIILRYFMLADMNLTWVFFVFVGCGSFVVGSKWLLENVSRLKAYRDMWPVFCVVNVFAWTVHASQIDLWLAESPVGAAFASVTLLESTVLLRLSGVSGTVYGDVIFLGAMSKIGPVGVTGLCSGFLSFMMFTVAFSIVLFDVGKTLGAWRLGGLFLLGVAGTFLISGFRVYLVLVLGYYWGLDAMETGHLYLGYVLFLCLISAFWYATLNWSRRLQTRYSMHT
jgi:exosortase/archaeosortase family protein